MSLAASARAELRRRPFLHAALAAGVVNYTAAARLLDVGETEAVVVALRRYAERLPDPVAEARDARVTMHSGLAVASGADGHEEGLLAVGGGALVDGGTLTGVLATGAVDASALAHVLGRLATEGVAVVAAGVADGALVVAVERADGPDAVRIVEESLSAVRSMPTPTD